MLVIEQKKNEQFISKGDRISELYIVLKGSVCMVCDKEEIVLDKGAVIGLMECAYGHYFCDFYAREDTILVTYAFKEHRDLRKIFDEQPQYVYAFLHASLTLEHKMLKLYRQLFDMTREVYLFLVRQYREYQSYCGQMEIAPLSIDKLFDIKPIELNKVIKQWEIDYIKALGDMPEDNFKLLYGSNQDLCIGELCNGSVLMHKVVSGIKSMHEYLSDKTDIFLNDNQNDMLGVWFELAKSVAVSGQDISLINKKVKELQTFMMEKKLLSGKDMLQRFHEFWSFDFEAYAAAAEKKEKENSVTIEDISNIDYFEYIVNYADFDEEKLSEIRELRMNYVEAVKNERRDNDAIETRKRMTELFYEIYDKIFFKSVEAEQKSPIIGLFLNFGFLDTQLVEAETVNQLLQLNELIENQVNDHVFTIYQWLYMIFRGERETSKNEFGLDYFGSLRELRKANRISAEDEQFYKMDREKMVRFEIENMFKSTNRMTYGRSLIYSPVLQQDQIEKNPNQMWLSADKLDESINRIRELDFGCFYRDILFYDSNHDGGRMEIKKEILPDIILLPNAGHDGVMWQESVGTDRTSPARFAFPIMSVMDIDNVMLNVAGHYRWEICRKMQGVRWNDVTEKSLTSEYYDYLAFYKKNKSLSVEAKEKIKSQLLKNKGSYTQMFVQDYVLWMKYESKGNFRVNKVAREILSKYCPFVADTRYKLLENPIFRGVFSKYENYVIVQENKFKNALKKYKDHGGEITVELMEALHYYQK